MRKFMGLITAAVLAVATPMCTTTAFAASSELPYLTTFKAESVTKEEYKTCDGTNVYSFRNEEDKLLFSSAIKDDWVYTTDYLNIRHVPTIESTPVAVVAPGTKLTRIADGSVGWDTVIYDGNLCFVYDKYVTTEKPKVEKVQQPEQIPSAPAGSTSATYSASQLRSMGVINWGGYRWTWYSQRVLPGGGLRIPGRHVDANGYVCDENGYICLASGSLSKGTIVDTPFGKKGKVYDCGCANDVLDVYTSW